MNHLIRFIFLVVLGLYAGCAARADRVVLAPSGRIVAPGDMRVVYLWNSTGFGQHGRLHLGIPKDDLGLELEIRRDMAGADERTTLALQYSIISEAFTNNLAPAVSVGILDVPNRAYEGRSWYVAFSKTLGLSAAQERWLTAPRIHAGYGSHRMGGGFIGASARVTGVIDVAAEYYGRKLNTSVRLRLAGPAGLTLQTHDDVTRVGVDVVITR